MSIMSVGAGGHEVNPPARLRWVSTCKPGRRGEIRCLTSWTPACSADRRLGAFQPHCGRRRSLRPDNGETLTGFAEQLQVRGLLEPSKAARTQWIVRIRCTPSTARALAGHSLTWPTPSWISLTTGGRAEIVGVLGAPSDVDRPPRPPGDPRLERYIGPSGRRALAPTY